MARTWNPPVTPSRAVTEEAVQYSFERQGSHWVVKAALPGRGAISAPVETTVGGARHGVSFLLRLHEVNGLALERAPLLEARYLQSSPLHKLVLSPGFPPEAPATYETALGRALSPSFEEKCLSCHGTPQVHTAGGGVQCAACHGDGIEHLKGVAAGTPRTGLADAKESCARCHAGFTSISDPLPNDTLISNQVNALKQSECFIQSDGRIGCTNCHDPHVNGSPGGKTTATCLGCHSERVAGHAALCPVNRSDGCAGCHMPEVRQGSFEMADHWIRVHPGADASAAVHEAGFRSQVAPRSMFLRIVVTKDRSIAETAHSATADQFFNIAQHKSEDASAAGGGFLGSVEVSSMDPALAGAARQLWYGERSAVIEHNGNFIVLAREARDFRERAGALASEAQALRNAGKLQDAAAKYEEALRVYPYLLRGLIGLGTTVGQSGNMARALGILELAARLYPRDASVQYNIGIVYGALRRGPDEIVAYRRALDFEPDLVPAYENLAAALLGVGESAQAAEVCHRGLNVDPLSAALYFNLSAIEDQQGDAPDAQRHRALAAAIDPRFAR